jgi:hypothetical protein
VSNDRRRLKEARGSGQKEPKSEIDIFVVTKKALVEATLAFEGVPAV